MLKQLKPFLQLTLVSCALISSGCHSGNPMESAEKRYQQNVKKKLLIAMDIDTMFSDDKLRQLAYAAGKGRISTIDKLLESGVDINAKGTRNATALFWSMRN
jgi:ankyrin repeat protein